MINIPADHNHHHTSNTYKPYARTDAQRITQHTLRLERAKQEKGFGTSNKYHNERYGRGNKIVTQATHKETGQEVAIKKFMYDEKTSKDGFPLISLREIAILKKLKHPNVIEALDIILVANSYLSSNTRKIPATVYVVFPFMNHDLMGIIDSPQLVSLKMPQIKCYAMQLLKGLAYIHANGLLHRDMKCANVLISNDGQLKIADFGLGRQVITKTRDRYTVPVVTRYYRPPELLMGEEVYTAAIDVWGAGVIIAEMVYGKFLFPGPSDLDTLTLIFELVGTPNSDNWPSFHKLKFALHVGSKHLPNTFRQKFPNQADDFYDFLYHLLRLDPSRRVSAEKALRHRWFGSEPQMCEPRDCPQYSSNMFELTASRDRKRNQQMSNSNVPPPPPSEPVYDSRMVSHGRHAGR